MAQLPPPPPAPPPPPPPGPRGAWGLKAALERAEPGEQDGVRALLRRRAGSYDEDSNHEPCLRRGYKAHWAIASGALLGLQSDVRLPPCQEDAEIPGLFHASPPVPPLPADAVAETYLLAKQGKSCRYQLWSFAQVQGSNAQLTELSPRRAADGKVYIVPAGGLREGLCGKAVLLRPGGLGGGGGSH